MPEPTKYPNFVFMVPIATVLHQAWLRWSLIKDKHFVDFYPVKLRYVSKMMRSSLLIIR